MHYPANYPKGCTDEQIEKFIDDCSKHLYTGTHESISNVSSWINLGQNELQRRILRKSAEESSWTTKIIIFIAVISLVLSFAAIYFTIKTVKSEDQWQKDEINSLQQIRDKK